MHFNSIDIVHWSIELFGRLLLNPAGVFSVIVIIASWSITTNVYTQSCMSEVMSNSVVGAVRVEVDLAESHF